MGFGSAGGGAGGSAASGIVAGYSFLKLVQIGCHATKQRMKITTAAIGPRIARCERCRSAVKTTSPIEMTTTAAPTFHSGGANHMTTAAISAPTATRSAKLGDQGSDFAVLFRDD